MFEDQNTGHPRQDQRSWRDDLRGHAVLVRGTACRTRIYMTLRGAENAVARARERGDFAEMCLVRLTPVPGRRWR